MHDYSLDSLVGKAEIRGNDLYFVLNDKIALSEKNIINNWLLAPAYEITKVENGVVKELKVIGLSFVRKA